MPPVAQIFHSALPGAGQYCSLPQLNSAWLLCRLLVVLNLRLVAQNGVQQRAMNLYFSVVADDPLFSKLVHEEADAGPRRADHFRQRFLTEGHRDRRSAAFLAEIRQQQQQTREASFGGMTILLTSAASVRPRASRAYRIAWDPATRSSHEHDRTSGIQRCGNQTIRSRHDFGKQHPGLCAFRAMRPLDGGKRR